MSCSSSFISIGCTHRPIHDESYCKWVIRQVDEIKPKVFIHNGDLFDQDCVGKFAKGDSPSLKKEYDSANGFLEEINEKLPSDAKKVYMMGNHCARIFREENKHLSELLDFRIHVSALKDWQIFEHKQHPKHIFRLGQVSFYHGFGVTSRLVTKEAVRLSGPNTLMVGAHTHRGYGPKQIVWGQDLEMPYWVCNTGCGISSDVEYFQTRDVSAWNRGMIVGECELRKRDRPNWDVQFLEHSRIWD